ncbi:unnamed protein product [Meloidogyne enterolobii]|uniref:Uncharacterized protein n=1 Tax=Meloidogyne enterolobii TaxID=390850 RepID=A0ACB0XUZ9_MELEN
MHHYPLKIFFNSALLPSFNFLEFLVLMQWFTCITIHIFRVHHLSGQINIKNGLAS